MSATIRRSLIALLRLEVYPLYWNIYGTIQIGSENLKFLVGILNLLGIHSVIVNIPATSVYYKTMDKYI